MAKTDTAAEPENALLAPQTMDKFQGFATKDGEPLTEKATKAPVDEKIAAAKAKANNTAERGDDEPEEDDETEQQTAKSKSAQDRINKSVAKQRAAERRADAAETSNRALEARLARLEAGLTTRNEAPKKDPNAPDPSNYKNGDIDVQYIADLSRYESRKAIADDRAANDKAASDAQAAKNKRAFEKARNKLEARGIDKYGEDFADVAFDEDVKISPTLGELLLDSDHGHEILYGLASDDKEAERIFGMSPARQAAWFGQQEAKLSSETPDADDDREDDEEEETPRPRKSPKTSQAPTPPEFRARGSSGTPRTNAATSDFAAFERMATGGRK